MALTKAEANFAGRAKIYLSIFVLSTLFDDLFFENRIFNPKFCPIYTSNLFNVFLLEIDVLKPLNSKILSIFDRIFKNFGISRANVATWK